MVMTKDTIEFQMVVSSISQSAGREDDTIDYPRQPGHDPVEPTAGFRERRSPTVTST
jgi:hypothetical protein